MLFPSAILLVNNDLTTNTQNMLVRQLNISEVIDGSTYDSRITLNASYPTQVHNNNLRLLVIRSLTELDNRNTFDVVAFIKAGLIAVIPFGNPWTSPGATYPITDLTWAKLLLGMKIPPNHHEDDEDDGKNRRDQHGRRIHNDDTQDYSEWDVNDLNNLDRRCDI